MKKLHIAIRHKTQLTQKLESLYEVTYHKEQTFFQKLFSNNEQTPDIYFHQGVVNDIALNMIEKATKTVVNSQHIKDEIVKQRTYIPQQKIDIVYPYLTTNTKYDKQIKKSFMEEYNISKDTRIIYFTGKNLKQSGIDKFFKIIQNLDRSNFKVIIDTDTKQLELVQMKIDKSKMIDTFILLENYSNKDHLFIISDIFILPTKQKLFAQNILKAIYFKSAVFVTKSNPASEIVDSFALIRGDDDPSTSFKVDALLISDDELKKVKKLNSKMSKLYTLENSLATINHII